MSAVRRDQDVRYRDAVVTSTTAKCRRPSVQGAAVTVRNRCIPVSEHPARDKCRV